MPFISVAFSLTALVYCCKLLMLEAFFLIYSINLPKYYSSLDLYFIAYGLKTSAHNQPFMIISLLDD